MSRVLRAAYLAIAVAVAGFLAWRERDTIGDLLDGARPAYLALALLLAFGQLAINSAFWRAAMAALGEHRRYATVLDASSRSLLARHIPGSVWYALGRSVILHREADVSRRVLATVALLEAALSLLVAVVAGVAFLAPARDLPGGVGWAMAAAAAGALAVSPPVLNRVLGWAARRRGGDPPRLDWPSIARLTGWTVVFWTGSTAMFSAYLAAFPNALDASAPELIGSYLLAWSIGFVALFAPQGAGVFEAAVASLLATNGVASLAIVVAGFRALTLVRDALAVAGAAVLPPRRPRQPRRTRRPTVTPGEE